MRKRTILPVLCICFFLLIGAEGMKANARNDTNEKNDAHAEDNAQSEKKTEAIMEGWGREQLKGLGDMAGEIYIRASEETIPVSVLSYFTKAEYLTFNMWDTGI